MAVRPIPEGYHTVTTYFVVSDNRKFLGFIERAFGATITYKSQEIDGVIHHAEAKIGDSMIMSGQAMEPTHPPMPCAVYLYVEDTDAWYNRAVAAGGKSTGEPETKFYGDRNAGVEDEWGNKWWLGTHVEDVAPEELKRRETEFLAKQPK